MRKWILPAVVFCLPFSVQAQPTTEEGTATAREAGPYDRMFLSFGQEATLVDRQWWEGQLEYRDGDQMPDATILRVIAAFQPWDLVEIGGTVGFGNAEGSGATDMDLWIKYHFGEGGRTEWATGGLLTVPTGDDAAGLGNDSFALGAFGSMRHRADRFTFSGNVAVRANDDGIGSVDGKTSFVVGAGVMLPANDRLSWIGETQFESARFSGGDSDLRALGGINLATGNRGAFRAALSIGLTNGAPNGQLILGYASMF